MLLSDLKVLPSNDDITLNVKHGNDTVCFRCVNSNARRLWKTHLEQAIDMYAITVSEQQHGKVSTNGNIIGRLLIEVMSIQNFNSKTLDSNSQILRLSLGESYELFEVDLTKKSDLHLTAQFPFVHTSLSFTIKLLKKNLFSPDVPLLEEGIVPLSELIRESSNHRGPLIKPLHLRKDVRDKTKPVGTVTVKFAIQMFDASM
ncbi:unnamed protein product [Strongylus vulgaris]|uniref:PH domain-containing protein n=1 Tax=Strongylus vulgaris TaxID=40348 RepID=A0A3P7J157_STRVU|nr:unnamed protein product [Strongylus vulgaris]